MIIKRITGATRVLGQSQGYLGLPVRDEIIVDKATLLQTPSMLTAWEPTPDELARLNAGAPVLLRVLGSGHPPVMIEVGDAQWTEETCPGHVASPQDPRVCGRCGVHIAELQPPEDEGDAF